MKKYILLLLIALLFLISRLYKIDQVPSSVYWDEASIGYNAYAISQDLRDEWGEFVPLHFRAFGEFKLPVYIYSVVPFVKLFGLSPAAVRIPAVIFSLGVIVITYILVAKITKHREIGLMSAFFLSVSPWLFIFSRTGYEATAGLFFFLCFIYSLLQYEEKRIYILPAMLTAILAFYSYNSFRILVPLSLMIFSAYLVWNKKLVIFKRPYLELIAIAFFLIALIPAIKLFYFDTGGSRLGTVGVSDPAAVVRNYLSHFDPMFLFQEGDINNRHQQPGWGQLYIIEAPLIIVGIWSILKSKNKLSRIFLLSLIIAPIPGSIAKEAPHALRSILLSPTFASISAIGLWYLAETSKRYNRIVIAAFLIIYFLFFKSYYTDFLSSYNQKTSSDWQLEYKEIFLKYKDNYQKEEKIIVSDQYAQPYIFALFYLKYPPSEFRKTVNYNSPDKWGFSTVASFDNFEFTSTQ